MSKPLPIGIENFEQLCTEEYYYIDKTLLVKELLDVSASKHSVTDKQHSFCYDISNLFFEALFMLMYKTAAFRQFI